MAAIVSEISKQVKQTALKADVNDIDAWWKRTVTSLVALVAMAWKTVRGLTEKYLREHAALEGREVDPVLAQWVTEQVMTSLRVTGPVAFKTAVREGADPISARVVMSTRLAGSAQRLVLEGERQTVERTVEDSGEIIGWRRVGDGDPCAFCAMLIARGAVYLSAASAVSVVGRGGRRRGTRALGMDYHDWDGCTAEPVYEFEDEPGDVAALDEAWQRVTEGLSGKDALNAWREWWDGGGRENLDLPAEARERPARRREPLQVTPFDPAQPIPGEEDPRFLNLDDEPLIDPEQAARDRQAEIDEKRTRAELLAELEQLIINQAEGDVLARQAQQAAERLGLADDEAFVSILRYAASGNVDLLQASIETVAERLGLTRIGGDVESLQVVRFEPARHKVIGRDKPGRHVEIARPGYEAVLDSGERVQLFRADVEPTDREPLVAARAPKPVTGAKALEAVPLSSEDESLSGTERETIRSYRGTGFSNLNQVLRVRAGKPMPKSWKWMAYPTWVRDLDGMMQRSPLGANVQVYRGISRGERVFGDAWRQSLTGAEYTEHGYLSTSADRAIAEDFDKTDGAVFVLRAPKGVGAIRLSGADYESELLLQRGLTIRVTKDSGPGPNRVIEGEIVLAGPAPLHTLTVAQLKALAKTRGVRIPSGAVKADIVKLLSSSPAETPLDVSKMTVPQLKQLAAERGIKVTSKDRKPDILAKLAGDQKPLVDTAQAAKHLDQLVRDGIPERLRASVGAAMDIQAGLVPRAALKLAAVQVPAKGADEAKQFARKQGMLAFYHLVRREMFVNPGWAESDDRGLGISDHAVLSFEVGQCRASRWFTPSSLEPLGGICSHEFGHHVANTFMNGHSLPESVARKLLPAIEKELGTRSKVGSRDLLPVERKVISAENLHEWVSQNSIQLKGEVSHYAATSWHELMAEIWQEYSTMGERARPGIRRIGAIMQQLAEEAA